MSQTFTGASVTLTIASSSISKTTFQTVWTIVNIMQMLVLFPLIAKYMSEVVTNFILANGFSIFSINFKEIDSIEPFRTVKDTFDFEQSNQYLTDLGMQSGSTLINNGGLLIILLSITAVHLLIFLIQKL